MYLLDKHLLAGVGRVLEHCDFVSGAYSSSVEDPTAQLSLVELKKPGRKG
jgi:hypothetical protein